MNEITQRLPLEESTFQTPERNLYTFKITFFKQLQLSQDVIAQIVITQF